MKKYLQTIVLVAAILIASPGFSEVKQEPQKNSVSFTITYNAMTLEQAAQKEKEIKDKFKDACSVAVNVKNVDAGLQLFNSATVR